MRFTLTIECDSAAFEKDPFAEIARIVGKVADRVGGDYTDQPPQFARGFCRDINGNRVGTWEIEP